MMKILIRLMAIFLLLRILGGYAHATPSLSLTSPTEASEMGLAEGSTAGISLVDLVEVINTP